MFKLAAEIDVDYLQMEIPKAIQQSLDGVKRVAEIVGAMRNISSWWCGQSCRGPEPRHQEYDRGIEEHVEVCRELDH